MRINTNLPKDETFFSKYADLLPTLFFCTIVANLISGSTEIFTIFTICKMKLTELAPEYAFEVSVMIAILGTAFIELGLRKFVPAAAKAVLYKRIKGLEKWLSFFVFVICLVLIASSALLSFQGSFEIVENLTGIVIEENDSEISKRRDKRENRILGDYKKDKGDINKRFDSQIKSTKAAYDAKIEKQWSEYRKFKIKEKSEGNSYKSKKAKIKSKIEGLKADKAAEVAQMEGKKNIALNDALSTKNASLTEIKTDYSNDKGDIKNKNQKRAKERTSKVEKYGLGLGWFTLICLFIFILCTIVIEIIKKGSEIEEKPMPSAYFFKEGFLSDLWETGTEQLQRIIFGFLDWWKNRISPPLPPTDKDIPILFDTEVEQQKVAVRFKENGEKPKIELPPLSLNFVEQMEEKSEAEIVKEKRRIGYKTGNNQTHQNLSTNDGTISATVRAMPNTYSTTNEPTNPRKIRGFKPTKSKQIKPTKDYIIYDGRQHELEPKKYSYSRVTSLISKHRKRIRELNQVLKNNPSKRNKDAMKNNVDWIDYWEGRLMEFFE